VNRPDQFLAQPSGGTVNRLELSLGMGLTILLLKRTKAGEPACTASPKWAQVAERSSEKQPTPAHGM